jgi:AraC family transcriptional regulator, regulatory protein of adaptative response / methylated-DNA-[protein]-cysteine methyltransferase
MHVDHLLNRLITIEEMTPGEYGYRGDNLDMHFGYGSTRFGRIMVAATGKGICHLGFVDDECAALAHLQSLFPKARCRHAMDAPWKHTVHLKGTPFQLKVWRALLQIPAGDVRSYGMIAKDICHPKAHRAVGTAVANNPVAYLIPCHRVIRSTGNIGQYRWGHARKTAMLRWEKMLEKSGGDDLGGVNTGDDDQLMVHNKLRASWDLKISRET